MARLDEELREMGEIIELNEKRDSTQDEIRKNKDQLRELRVGEFET